MEFVLFPVSLSQWNDLYTTYLNPTKKPYLSYIIRIKTTRLNIHNLSEKQVSLYQRICELKDKGFMFKEIAKTMTDEGWTSTRNKTLTASLVCSSYYKIRKHFERKYSIYYPPDVDDVELIWK